MSVLTEKINEIIRPENLVYAKSPLLNDDSMHYCPGCSHGVVHRLIAEVIHEMGIQEQTIGVSPVGCAVFAYNYIDIDWQEAAHGRAPAVATGIKRVMPEKYVFSYQGDGDLAAIGTAETFHAVNRGENIVMIFINNAIYGMTGGQMAPTTLDGQITTTSPFGRDCSLVGRPIDLPKTVATLEGAVYVAACSVDSPKNILQTKKCIRKAFLVQQKRLGFSLVSVLSTCPTNWGLSPVDSLKWLQDNMMPSYQMGELKMTEEVQAL